MIGATKIGAPMLSKKLQITLVTLVLALFCENSALAKNVSQKTMGLRKLAVASKTRQPMSKENKNKLFLDFMTKSKSRGEIFKVLSRAIPASDYRFAFDIAQKNSVDMRAPISLKIENNGTMTIGKNNEKIAWNTSNNSMIYRNQSLAYDKKLSMKDNFNTLTNRLRTKGTAFRFAIPEAHAEAVPNEALTDLNYVLYVMANSENQAALDNLGPDYAAKFDKKLQDLIQKYKFQAMRCDAGAHNANATMVFGTNADIEVSIQDLGTETKSLITRQGGQIISEEPIAESQRAVLDGLFDEMCLNNNNEQLLEKGSTIHEFGGVAQ
jgi:hypothetical protein